MKHFEAIRQANPDQRDQTRAYVFDMIRQLAKLARQTGERSVAIQLEAIIAARHAAVEDRLFL